MNFYDPYTGHQIRALRADPTGRHNPILLNDMTEPWWYGYVIGIAGGCALFLVGWLLS